MRFRQAVVGVMSFRGVHSTYAKPGVTRLKLLIVISMTIVIPINKWINTCDLVTYSKYISPVNIKFRVDLTISGLQYVEKLVVRDSL